MREKMRLEEEKRQRYENVVGFSTVSIGIILFVLFIIAYCKKLDREAVTQGQDTTIQDGGDAAMVSSDTLSIMMINP